MKKDKAWTAKHYIDYYISSNTNRNKIGVNSSVPEGQTVPASLVAPAVSV